MKRKKVILVTLDALAGADAPAFAALPGFARVLREGAWCLEEKSVYPSLTFPAHASIATGCVPGRHGIVGNYIFDPGAEVPRWNFYAGNLKRRALWDYAAEAGKTVLSLSWPVSGGANIRYNLPEMSPAKPKVWSPQMFARQVAVLMRHGTPGLAAGTLLKNPALARAWFLGRQPTLDIGMLGMFKKALPRYDWDIAMLHVYGLDDEKHQRGTHSPQVKKYLGLYSDFLNWLLDYADAQNARGESVTVVVTGDHAQLDTQHSVYLNRFLAELGLCTYHNGALTGWRALFDSGDGMAYLRVAPGEDAAALANAVSARLEGCPGIAQVLLPEVFRPLGCDPDAALVVEAAPGYGLAAGWGTGEALDEHYTAPCPDAALHGYLPEQKGYETVFLCYGPDVRSGKIEEMCITDIAPTLCEYLGLRTDEMDGHALEGLFCKGGAAT